jgi:hypothetical protein
VQRTSFAVFSGLSSLFGLAVLAALASCSSSSSSASSVDAGTGDAGNCVTGFQESDGGGCDPILPASDCAVGTSPTIGNTSCVPVGTTSCATGFTKGAPGASGWGCDAVIPTSLCTGATREAIGSSTCVPIGDCNAAFPPSNATIFVDASYTGAQIDGTHFAALDAALAAAPPNAVIAVESGAYSGQIIPTNSVSIIGRCAEKVVFTSTDPTASAIELGPANNTWSISGITLTNYHGAVSVLGGSATLDSIVVDGNHYAGVVVGNSGTKVTLKNSVVRGTRMGATDNAAFGLYIGYAAQVTVDDTAFADNDYINVGLSGQTTPNAKLTLTSSVVRSAHPAGAGNGFGWGIYGSLKVSIDVEQSAIIGNQGFGVNMYSTAASNAGSAVVNGSLIKGTTYDPVNKVGIGFEAGGSSVDIESSTVTDNNVSDVYGSGTTVKIANSTLGGTSSTDPNVLGPVGLVLYDTTATLTSDAIVSTRTGADFQGTSTVEMDNSLVSGTQLDSTGYYVNGTYVGVGITVESKATLTSVGSAILGVHTAGILSTGNTTLTNLLVRGTRAGGDGAGGRALSAENNSTMTVSASAFIDNSETGIAVASSALTIDDSLVDKTSFDPSNEFGIGILLVSPTAIATIGTTTLRGGAGPALAVSAGGATVSKSMIIDNAVGIYVQDGSSLVQGDGSGDPKAVAISSDTVFTGNTTRIASGSIPLPPVLVK